MDFLKKLNLNDDKADTPADTTSASPPAHDKRSGGGLFEGFTHATEEIHPPTNQSQSTVAPPAHESESIIDKLSDVLYKPHYQEATPSPVAAPALKEEDRGGLLGKISSVLNEGKHESAPASSPPKDEGLLGMISGAFAGDGEKPVPVEKKDEGLFGKIGGVLGHGGHREEPAKPQSFGDKIHSALGGGTAGEEKEGGFDKAIDFVQEHVFGAGPQDNESAFEQLKDKQIAETIKDQFRKVTGHESAASSKK
ncbi:hypothetical protein Hypma_013622 [Hypsizygus marmoreus]|uniref:Uncharacterized protein n=1 Tax=Hypsizygus marmoreus TaxID=39966 RepID=A0A369JC70_HYPMA|nr:hypothetical protein Hypma_013622 [Hypsizygus marmoreus]